MKNFLKILLVLTLVLAMALTFAACDDDKNEDESILNGDTSVSTPPSPYDTTTGEGGNTSGDNNSGDSSTTSGTGFEVKDDTETGYGPLHTVGR